ncbi:MAG: SCO family protein [Pseudomonadota bacterium]
MARRRHATWALAAMLLGLPLAAAAETLDPQELLRVSQAAVGQRVGDYTFTDPAGRRISLASLQGKPYLVSFIYTGCYQICPTTTRFLAKAVQAAQESLGRDSFTVLTIGFNLPFDNPQAMGAFARQQGVSAPNWHFLTPDAGDLKRMTADFGFRYAYSPKGYDHILQVSVVDQEGRIYAQVYGDQFDVPSLVKPLKDLLTDGPRPRRGIADLVERVRLLCTVYDPSSGTYRLNYDLFYKLFGALAATAFVLWFIVHERRRSRRLDVRGS